jgi:hypothetical protein
VGEEEEQWLRAVYAKSDRTVDQSQGYAVEGLGTYVTVVVVVFPEGLMDSSDAPWNDGAEKDRPMEVESEKTFLLDDGWISNIMPVIEWNSAGSAFVFSMDKLGNTFITEALDYDMPDFDTDRSNLIKPRANVQPHFFIYQTPGSWAEINPPSAGLIGTSPDPQPILQAEVTCLMDTVTYAPRTVRTYKRTVNGNIRLFPHYNDLDQIQWVQLTIDEYQEQLWDSADISWVDSSCFCWRQRKMTFQSGKELIYMQQYMEGDKSYTFNPEVPPADKPGIPGDGTNFYVCIDYMDVRTANLMYTKHSCDDIYIEVPGLGAQGFRWYQEGTSDYIVDATITTADPLTPDTEVNEVVHTVGSILADGYGWNRLWRGDDVVGTGTSRDIYQMDMFPMAEPLIKQYTGETDYTALTVGAAQPIRYNLDFGDILDDNKYTRNAYNGFPAEQIDAFGRSPVTDYDVSCWRTPSVFGFSSVWLEGSGRLNQYSLWTHNVYPMFSYDQAARANLVQYGDLFVAAWEVYHLTRIGQVPPPLNTQPRPVGEYSYAEWAVWYPDWADNQITLTNFDIDALLEMSNVKAVMPFGRVG